MEKKVVIGVAWPKSDYVSSLVQAGAEVRELSPERDSLPGALDACDGLLLTGGPDVDPVFYGEKDRHETVELDAVRDAYEFALAREAMKRDLPLFAICRGAQVLNVAAGGTLIQDIPSQHPTDLMHSRVEPKNLEAHEINVAPRSCLSILLGDRARAGHLAVNSRHHQSVKTPAPGFVVSATAPDGVVEAIEQPQASFCLGVQWHPENFWRTGEFSGLFKGFVDAAEQYRSGKG